eukprot:14054-Chlamydomonas_euryale.AAC.3
MPEENWFIWALHSVPHCVFTSSHAERSVLHAGWSNGGEAHSTLSPQIALAICCRKLSRSSIVAPAYTWRRPLATPTQFGSTDAYPLSAVRIAPLKPREIRVAPEPLMFMAAWYATGLDPTVLDVLGMGRFPWPSVKRMTTLAPPKLDGIPDKRVKASWRPPAMLVYPEHVFWFPLQSPSMAVFIAVALLVHARGRYTPESNVTSVACTRLLLVERPSEPTTVFMYVFALMMGFGWPAEHVVPWQAMDPEMSNTMTYLVSALQTGK